MLYTKQRVAHIHLAASISPLWTNTESCSVYNTESEIEDVQVFRAWSLVSMSRWQEN